MSRDLQIEVPFHIDPHQLAEIVQHRAAKAGARVDMGDDGLGGSFLVKKLLLTIVQGNFRIVPGGNGSGGVAKVHVTDAAGFISDDQIRTHLTKLFSELES